jgi:hypothetical protein
MTTASVQTLTELPGLPLVDGANIDAFVAPAHGESPHAALFFGGVTPAERAEKFRLAEAAQAKPKEKPPLNRRAFLLCGEGGKALAP